MKIKYFVPTFVILIISTILSITLVQAQTTLPQPIATAVTSSQCGGYIDISWQPVSGATKYTLGERTKSSGLIPLTTIYTGTDTHYTDKETPDLPVWYRMTATTPSGETPLSTSVWAKASAACPTAPVATPVVTQPALTTPTTPTPATSKTVTAPVVASPTPAIKVNAPVAASPTAKASVASIPAGAYIPNPCFTYDPAYYADHPYSTIKLSNGRSMTIVNDPDKPTILNEIPLKNNCFGSDKSYIPAHMVLGDTYFDLNWKANPGDTVSSYADLTRTSIYPYNNPPLTGGINDISKASVIKQNEDKIIEYTKTAKPIVVGDAGPFGVPPYIGVPLPLSNCVHIGGNGPRKVVFMRDLNVHGGLDTLLKKANYIIEDGFKKYDPYKTYFDKFSFYIDLSARTPIPSIFSDSLPDNYVSDNDVIIGEDSFRSCSESVHENIPGNITILFINDADSAPGWADHNHFVTINLTERYSLEFPRDPQFYGSPRTFNLSIDYPDFSPNIVHIDNNLPLVVMHEIGHALGGLKDEYFNEDVAGYDRANCSAQPSEDFRNDIDNRLYGGTDIRGCLGLSTLDFGANLVTTKKPLFRPSLNSIMRGSSDAQSVSKYNVISCGYVLANIIEPENNFLRLLAPRFEQKIIAQKYWPICMNLDTDKTSIPAQDAKPTLLDTTPVSGQLDTFLVTGDKLGPRPSIKLTLIPNIASLSNDWNLGSVITSGITDFFSRISTLFSTTNDTAAVVTATTPPPATYIFNNLTSNGTSVTFTAAGVPKGRYKVSAAAFNSGWTDTNFIIDVSGTVPPTTPPVTPPVVPPVTPPTSSTYTLTTSANGGGSISCTPNCPTSVPSGKVITFYAIPYDASKTIFTGWSGGSCTGTDPTCVLTITQNTTVTASFTRIPTVPGTPTRPISPKNVTAVENPQGTITITWTDSSSNESVFNVGIASYKTTGIPANSLVQEVRTDIPANSTSYTFTPAQPSHVYDFAIQAKIISDDPTIKPLLSGYQAASITTKARPARPAVTLKALSSSSIQFNWTDTNTTGLAQGYTIVNGTTLAATFAGDLSTVATNLITAQNILTKTYTLTGLTPNTKYCYFVYAVANSLNASLPSVRDCATTLK